MDKKSKKELELEIVTFINEKLAKINKVAAKKSGKNLKSLAKYVIKKFNKEFKKSSKKQIKSATKRKVSAKKKSANKRVTKSAR